jgi:hypothetical protein
MIATTPFEEEIVRRVQAGELCPSVLDHGDFCGRDIHDGYRLGLCEWHAEEILGIQHKSDDDANPPERVMCSVCGVMRVRNRGWFEQKVCQLCRPKGTRRPKVHNV